MHSWSFMTVWQNSLMEPSDSGLSFGQRYFLKNFFLVPFLFCCCLDDQGSTHLVVIFAHVSDQALTGGNMLCCGLTLRRVVCPGSHTLAVVLAQPACGALGVDFCCGTSQLGWQSCQNLAPLGQYLWPHSLGWSTSHLVVGGQVVLGLKLCAKCIPLSMSQPLPPYARKAGVCH